MPATLADLGGRGGGIHVEAGGEAVLVNATVSRNTAAANADNQSWGGGIYTAGSFSIEHATISGNSAIEGGGLYQAKATAGGMAMWNTIFSSNSAQACGGTLELVEESHNLADDTSCGLDAAGDLDDVGAGLTQLEDNGGPTDTHGLALDSKAIDAATTAHCPAADQRGIARPESNACDMGAVERRPTPVVTTRLDGDDGACDPGDCTLREALVDSERGTEIYLEEGTYEVTLGELQLRNWIGASSAWTHAGRRSRRAAPIA